MNDSCLLGGTSKELPVKIQVNLCVSPILVFHPGDSEPSSMSRGKSRTGLAQKGSSASEMKVGQRSEGEQSNEIWEG